MSYQSNNSTLIPHAVLDCLASVNLSVDDHAISEALRCRTCKQTAKRSTVAANYSPGTCILLECGNKRTPGKKCINWFICVDCKKYVDRRRVNDHFKSNAHMKAATDGSSATTDNAVITNHGVSAAEELSDDADSLETFYLQDDDNDGDGFNLMDDNYYQSTTHDMVEPSQEKEDGVLLPSHRQQQHLTPSINERFESVNRPDLFELANSFGDQQAMMYYFTAEHSKQGGGIQYLIARAFRRTEYIGTGYNNNNLPTQKESCWHFRNFVQYISMSDKQRIREASILRSLVASIPSGQSLFQHTRSLSYRELNKFYGRSNQHTVWNALPVPTVENIGGIAYTNPLNVIRFLFAFGTDVDEYLLDLGGCDALDTDSSVTTVPVVHGITQCKAFRLWENEILKSKLPAFLNSYQSAFLLWAVDWRDGFGSNRTKQNRKSTNAWTFSLSTPSDRVNSLANTLPIAIGLKKNPFWPEVEHRFRKDMAELAGGLHPIMVYHGGIGKCVPIFVRRLACLTDKVERADYTSTLSCTSPLHRCFGKIINFDPPKMNVEAIEQYIENQKSGQHDLKLKQFGWSCDYVERTTNGGSFPACYGCRKKNVDWLRIFETNNYDQQADDQVCSLCGNWTLNSTTKKKLSFKAPKNYPTRILPGCPITPPLGREAGLDKLEYIDVTFPMMIQAARFAFYHSCSGRNQGWTKAVCQAYLRCCGINGRNQDLIYDGAVKAYSTGEVIDYEQKDGIGGFKFPAAWIGDMQVHLFIEMLMHLFFLGVAESNFQLISLFMSAYGWPVETFKRTIQRLLVVLTRFNLSWLLALPFSGNDKKRTTGTWVSENWLAFVRISKIVYAYCLRKGIEHERAGANDIARMVTCFTALVARVLSHAGATESTSQFVAHILKEFLSSVRELDIRVRYKTMNALANSRSGSTPDGEDDKKRAQFWLKSNYISELNLPATIRFLGPLVNFWDGGGKGERYIQEIKPHIPRGVRDGGLFFVRLLEKVYKVNAMQQIEEKHNPLTEEMDDTLSRDNISDSDDEDDGDLEQCTPPVIGPTFGMDETSNQGNSDNDQDDEDDGGVSDDESEHDEWSTPMEDKEMEKARTFYVYKRKSDLDASLQNNDPVAGIIVKAANGSPQMYVIYKKPHTEFGWMKVSFADEEGFLVCGLWYAPLLVEEAESPPQSLKHATKLAKLASVAIPLRYTFGDNHEHGLKYCVITNWWRERNQKGQYVMPSLAFDLYQCNNA